MPSAEKKPNDRESLGTLFAKLSDHGSTLFRSEVELVKVEAKSKIKRSAISIAIFVVAAVLAYFALAVLVTAAVLGIATSLDPWLAALIVAGSLLLFAGLLVLIALWNFKRKSSTYASPVVRVKEHIATIVSKEKDKS